MGYRLQCRYLKGREQCPTDSKENDDGLETVGLTKPVRSGMLSTVQDDSQNALEFDMIIRTEWHRTNEQIISDLRKAGIRAIAVDRISGMYAIVHLRDGRKMRIRDGQVIGNMLN